MSYSYNNLINISYTKQEQILLKLIKQTWELLESKAKLGLDRCTIKLELDCVECVLFNNNEIFSLHYKHIYKQYMKYFTDRKFNVNNVDNSTSFCDCHKIHNCSYLITTNNCWSKFEFIFSWISKDYQLIN